MFVWFASVTVLASSWNLIVDEGGGFMSGNSGNPPNNPREAGQRRDVSWLGLETKLEQHEVDAMATDPAGFVASQIAEGYQSW